jgi:ABC-type antimicrobial peptide transport system permease subunit
VLKEVAWLVLLGTAIGLPCSYALGHLVETQLYGLSARDPWITAAATFGLLLVGLAAGYLPAARATRVDPLVALRHE